MPDPKKPKWWQLNREKLRGNLEEARRFGAAARNGPRGMAMRPYHPDHDVPPPDVYPPGVAGGDDRGSNISRRLAELQSLMVQGLITPQDFEQRKVEILRDV